MASHFEDAVADARASPRMWSVRDGDLLVGFVMISEGIPAERLAADDDLVGRTACGGCSSTSASRVADTGARRSTP
jgi:hypothetical protein